jgi:hypothetical protein
MIQDHVCSLEFSKKLWEVGIKVESEYKWEVVIDNYNVKPIIVSGDGWKNKDGEYNPGDKYETKYYPAPLASELGELLPDQLEIDGYIYNLEAQKIGNLWGVGYFTAMDDDEISLTKLGTHTEANARAKCLLYLHDKGLLTQAKGGG